MHKQLLLSGSWGHAQVAVLGKLMQWKDISGSSTQDLSGTAIGWGWTASTAIHAGRYLTFKVQTIHGSGVECHIADAPADVVPESNDGDPSKPVKGVTQPVWGFFSFAEIHWNNTLETTLGYSMESVTNGDLQTPDSFRKGQYALINLLYRPWTNILMGIEYQYGRRKNFTSDFSSAANKMQVSFKYNFSAITFGK